MVKSKAALAVYPEVLYVNRNTNGFEINAVLNQPSFLQKKLLSNIAT